MSLQELSTCKQKIPSTKCFRRAQIMPWTITMCVTGLKITNWLMLLGTQSRKYFFNIKIPQKRTSILYTVYDELGPQHREFSASSVYRGRIKSPALRLRLFPQILIIHFLGRMKKIFEAVNPAYTMRLLLANIIQLLSNDVFMNIVGSSRTHPRGQTFSRTVQQSHTHSLSACGKCPKGRNLP